MTTPMESLGLTPAESLMVLDSKKSSGKEMMKLTLLDLLIKQVLESETQQETKGRIVKKQVKKKYIRRGQNHGKFSLKPHEQAMASPFDSREIMEAKEMAREVFERVKGFRGYRNNYVREPLAGRDVFEKIKKKKLMIPYTSYQLSSSGLEILEKIKRLIAKGEDHFIEWMERDKDRARQFLAICGSNIFLLQKWDFETIKTWVKELYGIKKAITNTEYTYMWYDYDPFRSGSSSSDFDLSALDFSCLTGFDSFDDLVSGFDGLDAGDGGDD